MYIYAVSYITAANRHLNIQAYACNALDKRPCGQCEAGAIYSFILSYKPKNLSAHAFHNAPPHIASTCLRSRASSHSVRLEDILDHAPGSLVSH